ncbi:MAG: hypothetical protein ACI9IJ_002481 [Psychromonas sp.]|jgi:hypothetical protein
MIFEWQNACQSLLLCNTTIRFNICLISGKFIWVIIRDTKSQRLLLKILKFEVKNVNNVKIKNYSILLRQSNGYMIIIMLTRIEKLMAQLANS